MSDDKEPPAVREQQEIRGKNVVHKDDLRELVEEWRETAENARKINRKWTGEKKYIHYRDGKATTLERIADELEEVLEDG